MKMSRKEESCGSYNDVYILGVARTPIGKFLGGFKDTPATKLGGYAIRAALLRSNVSPADVDEVIMGNVISAGLGQAPARQAAIFADIPYEAAAVAVNKVCGSGLKSVMLATQAIKLGDIEIAVAGGMENMSMSPYMLTGLRTGLKMGHRDITDLMIHDGLWDVYNEFHMGMSGELIAEKYNISREEQDMYAMLSYDKAITAINNGRFKKQIVSVDIEEGGGKTIIERDECPRVTDLNALSKLPPVFKAGGSITAGNAPGLNDAGAAVVLANDSYVSTHKLVPMAKIIGYSTSGVDPKMVMMAPIPAITTLLKKTSFSIDQIDLIEVNEAFSVAAIAIIRELNLDNSKVNIYGGAVALGHPLGATGTILLIKLIYALKDKGLRYGIVSLCLGGGNAVALLIENLHNR